MNISIKNCNCIDEVQLTIAENKLNIKFGPNGTGKSTISKAINSSINEPEKLPELLPFKLRNVKPHDYNPEITGIEGIKSVRVFNEEYLSNFTFKDDELVENSFEIFIKTPEYKEKVQNVNRIISKIKDVFDQNENLEVLLSDLQELTRSFKTTSSGISKSSNFMKSCGSGNKLEHIPTGLEPYTAFLRAPQNVAWIGWQQQGHSFLEIADDCPFCATPAAATEKKEQIKLVADEYDKKTIQSLNSISDIIEKLGKYFSEETRERLTSITRLKDSPDNTEINFLFRVITQIDESRIQC
jgi:energy-coupling factor transporter ATP-binding protein EcfA2